MFTGQRGTFFLFEVSLFPIPLGAALCSHSRSSGGFFLDLPCQSLPIFTLTKAQVLVRSHVQSGRV